MSSKLIIKCFDLFFSTLGIILLIPLYILISLLIKLTTSGPIFFKQERVGYLGCLFFVYKFRTMYVNSESILLTIGEKDSRITKIGYYLRKSKLDELPQLFNVIKGDMSIVGPRPEVLKYVEKYSSDQKKILSIKPGITDWASIIYRNENAILEKSNNPEYDYIENIIPDKIRYNLIFIENYGGREYFKIIYTTLKIYFK